MIIEPVLFPTVGSSGGLGTMQQLVWSTIGRSVDGTGIAVEYNTVGGLVDCTSNCCGIKYVGQGTKQQLL